MSAIHCQLISPATQVQAMAFLEKNYSTSMYLLGNIEEFGTRLTDHPNSANFRVLLQDGQIRGVFGLTRRGNLLLSIPAETELFAPLADAVNAEALKLDGILGEWQAVSQLWAFFEAAKKVARPAFVSKEILYALNLSSSDRAANAESTHCTNPASQVRTLLPEDFFQWLPLHRDFNKEAGFTNQLSDEALRKSFFEYPQGGKYWGCFEAEALISVCNLSTKAQDIGQVGGVYTLPSHRRRGLAQKLLRRMFLDCESLHQLRRMILFTGETNISAQKAYEKIGFERIGHYGIMFGA